MSAQKLYQLVKHDLDDLFGRLQFLPDLLAFGLLLDRRDEVLRDLVVHIRFKEREAAYAYEDEDQSAPGVRPGMRVRHPQFGVGSVIAVEEHNDDMKITVRFNLVGVKKLLAKYAKLEPA